MCNENLVKLLRRGQVMMPKLNSNPACYPKIYKNQFQRGVEAKKAGKPRVPKDCNGECFGYSYEAGAWFDGYDSCGVETPLKINCNYV